MDRIRQHAEDFISKREAPAYIANDGKQTPMRGHPVFIAQHGYFLMLILKKCIKLRLIRYIKRLTDMDQTRNQ